MQRENQAFHDTCVSSPVRGQHTAAGLYFDYFRSPVFVFLAFAGSTSQLGILQVT